MMTCMQIYLELRERPKNHEPPTWMQLKSSLSSGDSSVDINGKIAKAGRCLVKYDHLSHNLCASRNVVPPLTPRHKEY